MFFECVGVIEYGEHHVAKASIKLHDHFFEELRDMLHSMKKKIS